MKVQTELAEGVVLVVAGQFHRSVGATPVPKPPHLLVGLVIVGEDQTALASTDLVSGVGRGAGDVTERPHLLPVRRLADGSAEALAVILDEHEPVPLAPT